MDAGVRRPEGTWIVAHRKPAVAGTLNVRGVEYVVIPKADYLRMKGDLPPGTVDAHEAIRGSIGEGLRAAREEAGLTQAELAERMGKSQTMVSQAESGTARVSERYVRAVLDACGLPADWNEHKKRGRKRRRTA
jgi:ribosome-binding protein aMBF1 (putative translation factor)